MSLLLIGVKNSNENTGILGVENLTEMSTSWCSVESTPYVCEYVTSNLGQRFNGF